MSFKVSHGDFGRPYHALPSVSCGFMRRGVPLAGPTGPSTVAADPPDLGYVALLQQPKFPRFAAMPAMTTISMTQSGQGRYIPSSPPVRSGRSRLHTPRDGDSQVSQLTTPRGTVDHGLPQTPRDGLPQMAAKAKIQIQIPRTSEPARSEAGSDAPETWLEQMIELLNSTALQTTMYLIFVVIFQSLADCVRMPEEYYFDKVVGNRIIENYFDSAHNSFVSIRRIADIYEWGNNVLIPGLFADMGPCSEDVGLPSALGAKGCNDDAWPDGEGSFQVNGATPLGLDELVKRMDQFDFTEGIYVKQVARAKRRRPPPREPRAQL